jgi:hypothetical protein
MEILAAIEKVLASLKEVKETAYAEGYAAGKRDTEVVHSLHSVFDHRGYEAGRRRGYIEGWRERFGRAPSDWGVPAALRELLQTPEGAAGGPRLDRRNHY